MPNRSIVRAVLLLLITAPTHAEQIKAQADTAAVRRAAETLQSAAKAASSGDCRTGARLSTKIVDDARAPSLPEALLAAGFEIVVACEQQLGRSTDAYRHVLAGTMLGASSDWLWRTRLYLELQQERTDAAVSTVEAMTQGRGAALNGLSIRTLYSLDGKLENANQTALRMRLLAILSGNGYVPDAPGATTDDFRYRYAGLLHAAGARVAAVDLIQRIEDPSSLLEVSLDPRFRDALPKSFDLRLSAERALDRARIIAERYPKRIAPINAVATYLRLLGRPQESLDALNPLRPLIADAAALEDRDAQMIWWWDGISRGYQMLGRYKEASEALKKGGEAPESGGLNVSQVINLAEVQLTFGDPAAALTTLRALDDGKRRVSPYGTMQIIWSRGCAKALLGSAADAATEIAFARSHAADDPGSLTKLLLCVGDVDGAALSLVGRLDDIEARPRALRDLCDFDDPPVALPPDPTMARWEEVKARVDVQAAIRRAGGTRRFHVQRIEF